MNEAIEKILRDRYYLPTENSWEELAKRISKLYDPITQDIIDMNFIPSSPTLMNYNTGNHREGTLSSCFPMAIEDSIEGIFTSQLEAALVTKAGGGIGYDFSSLRGNNEIIKGIGGRKSSGPLPFINMFDSMLDGIRQGGVRRGAGMALLSVEHPNILDFINAKKDLTKFTRFNFSINMTDKFYKQLEEYPDSPHQIKNITDDTYSDLLNSEGKPITVKQLWSIIIDNAYLMAEPGIYNGDIATRQCTTTNVDKRVIPNPCLRESVRLSTSDGLKQLKDVREGTNIWSQDGWATVTKKWKTGTKEVYKYYTTGGAFEATENHEVLSNGIKTPIGEATCMDTLVGEYYPRSYIESKSVMDGLVLGDGSVHKASNDLVYLNIGDDDSDYFSSEVSHLILRDRTVAFKKGWEVQTNITADEVDKTYNRRIPERYFSEDIVHMFSFLRGLYSANGSICGGRITYKTASFGMIQDLQIMLSYLGIRSYYTINKAKKVLFRNGEYECKQSYDLNITTDTKKFYESIGFIQKYKMDKVEKFLNKRVMPPKITFDIYKKELITTEDVYDITINNKSHTFWCDGFNISNCQEYTNVPYSSCNLGSINLSNFVEGKKFNWEKFESIIAKATRFLNNVIDENKFPVEKIKEVTLKIRPMGLGYMGLAHALFKKEIPYNSEKAFKFTEEVTRYLTLRAMKESVELAKEEHDELEYALESTGTPYEKKSERFGSYPAFDYDLFMKANERFFKHKHCRNIDIEALKEDIKKYGIRNSCFTSLAPTGTISTLAQVSSGMEPVFALSYMRKVEKLNKEYDIMYISDPVFDNYLTKNFDEKIKIKILKEVADNKGSCQKCKDIPDDMKQVFIVAGDLTPAEHLDILEAVARNISLSCSKTINLPKDIDKEEISKVFLDAYKRGVVGVTCYRDGSREGILIHNDAPTIFDSITPTQAPKRGKTLPCHIYRINTFNKETQQGEKWIIFVGLKNEDPYEVFAGKVCLVDIPTSIESGFITKVKRGLYQFEYNGEVIIKDIRGIFETGTEEVLSRLISTSLRHGTPVEYLNDQFVKSNGTVADFNKAIGKALKKYLKEKITDEICSECGSPLKKTGTCYTCTNPLCVGPEGVSCG